MGKDNLQHLYLYLQETDTFIGMRMFPTVHHREFPYTETSSLLRWNILSISTH